MLKKGLSLLLCIVMLISCFGATIVQAHAGVVSAKSLFIVDGTNVNNGKLNYTISITAQQKGIAGAILLIEYDSTVLAPVEENCVPCVSTNATQGTVQNFAGEFLNGVTEGNPNMYTIAYMNTYAESTGTTAKKFFNIEFQVIDDTRPLTDIKFYCKEYYSTEEADKVITPDDGLQEIAVLSQVPTLEQPVLVGVDPCNEGLKVKWNTVQGSIGYVIYRKTMNTNWQRVGLADGQATTEFIDTDLASGITYFYTVSAANNHGESSRDNIGVSKKFIAKPVITNIQNATAGIRIEWTEVQGADYYKVMRRGYGSVDWQQISSKIASAGTSYVDMSVEDGEWYEYDINSATDEYETLTAEYGTSINYVATPVISSIVNTTDGILVSWRATVNAVKYVIYRKEIGKDSQWVEYGETNLESFVDTEVQGGKAYAYSVKACTNDNESSFNSTGNTYTFVPPVPVKTIVNGKYSVDITWDSVPSARQYIIYRKAADSNDWVKLAVTDSTAVSFSDTTATSGGTYVYAVCSVISNSESAKAESEAIYFIKAPGSVVPKNMEEGILVQWDSVLGAAEYNVYKSVNDGEFTLLCKTSDVSITDTDVSFGSSYTYKVQSVNAVSQSPESDVSQTLLRISAIGKATPSLADGGISVQWDAVSGAEFYALFRNKGDGFVQIATVEECTYLDTRVESNVRYSYAVAAVVGGSVGVLNTESPQELLYIAPPAGIQIKNNSDNMTISWSAVNGAVEYRLYKGTNENDMELLGDFDSETLSFTDSDVAPGMVYTYKLCTKGAEGYSMFSEIAENMFLEVPKIKSLSNTYSGVKITWNESFGAESYRIYRRYAKGESWSSIGTVKDKLTFTDGTAQKGKTVYYTVKALNGESESSFASKSIVYLSAPEVKLSNTTSGVSVKWDKVTGANSYYVYRKTSSASGWSRIATVKTNSYTDKKAKSGTKYIYTVRAVGSTSNSGYKSAGWSIKCLSTPVIKSVNNAYNGVKVNWEKVKGANKYRVYRKAEGDKKWTSLGTTEKTYFVNKNAKDGIKYTYTVRAYYGSVQSGYNSKGLSKIHIAAPKVEIKNNVSGVYLYWDKIDSASSYYIYRKAGDAKSWKKVATVTKNTYTDTTAKSGTLYKYTVRAYGKKTLSGYYSTGWKTRYLNAPQLVSAESVSNGITFKWKPVTGATGYQIFRKEPGESWERIGTVKGANRRSFVDKKAQKGVRYTYTVKAYYGSYRSAYYSGVSAKR